MLNSVETVKDNAGLMFIKFLINIGVKEVLIAGMDGYSNDESENFALKAMQKKMKDEFVIKTNKGLNDVLRQYSDDISITFITNPRYVKL